MRRALVVLLIVAGCPHPHGGGGGDQKIVVPYRVPVGSLPELGAGVNDFTLPDQDGTPVHLEAELARHKSVAVMFYRGFW